MSIIRCRFSHLVERCEQRGYNIHNVMPCVLKVEGDFVYVDTEHELYPSAGKTPEEIEQKAQKSKEYFDKLNKKFKEQVESFQAQQQERTKKAVEDHRIRRLEAKKIKKDPENGVGTQLKKLLSKIGIKATPTCSCNQRAKTMDEKGIQWCINNVDTIVGWLKEEAQKRKLPFIDLAGKLLVHKAIKMAEKAEKKLN